MAVVENLKAAEPGEAAGKGGLPWLRAWPAAVVAAAYVPMAVLHGHELWARPHYQFFPLLFPCAAALLWHRVRNLGPLEPGPRGSALALAGFAWAVLALAVLLVSPALGAVAALVAVPAAAYGVGGRRLAAAVLPAVVVLAVAIPPPLHLDFTLVARLQRLVSGAASDLLDGLGVVHVMEGNVVEVGGRRLLVDQACSGVYSLFTLLAATLVYALWTRASWARAAVLLAASAFWVVAGNVLRIVTVVVLESRYDVRAAEGWRHEVLGIVGFLGMLAMLAATGGLIDTLAGLARMLRFIMFGTKRQVGRSSWHDLVFRYREVEHDRESRRRVRGERWRQRLAGQDDGPDDEDDASPRAAVEPTGPVRFPAPGRTWVAAPAAAAAFGLLLLPQAFLPGVDWGEVLADQDVEVRAFGKLQAGAMPPAVGPLKLAAFQPMTRPRDSSWGEYSRVWTYDDGSGQAAASLDHAFVGWHDLTECYTGQGWSLTSRRDLVGAGAGEGGAGTAVAAELSAPDGRRGWLVFQLFDRDGRGLNPPFRTTPWEVVKARVASWRRRLTAERPGEPTHQLQVFYQSPADVDADHRAACEALFRGAAKAVHAVPLRKEVAR